MKNINDILLKNLSEEELVALQQQFPYFAHLQRLIAKRNFKIASTQTSYNESTEKAAIVVSNREELKQFLYDIEEIFPEEAVLIIPEEKINIAEVAATIATENEIEIVAPTENIVEDTATQNLSIEEALAQIESTKLQLEKEPQETPEQQTEIVESTTQEEELPVSKAIEVDTENNKTEEILVEEIPSNPIENETTAPTTETIETTTATSQPFVYENSAESDSTIKYTFDQWFAFVEKRKKENAHTETAPSVATKETTGKDELDKQIEQNISYSLFEDTLKQETNYAKGLESFIASQKKKKEKIKTTFSASDAIITETYANLLVQQGKIDRAKETFRQLILKFPEKKRYFADQIEKLNNL